MGDKKMKNKSMMDFMLQDNPEPSRGGHVVEVLIAWPVIEWKKLYCSSADIEKFIEMLGKSSYPTEIADVTELKYIENNRKLINKNDDSH